MKNVKLGIIGGSGVYKMDGASLVKEHRVMTPFGSPSDSVFELKIGDKIIFFIPRHGRGHTLLPTEVNSRANIYALKSFGVTHLMAISAVGILREDIRPGDMVIPDQIFDRTKGNRPSTFFGDGIVGHVSFADPFSKEMNGIIAGAARSVAARVHEGGAYVCMEGPQFSTRAESHFYRNTLKPAVIGMTAIPESKLAREAEICYGMLALATDYDCWHETEEDVSITAVVEVLKANTKLANDIVKEVCRVLPESSADECLEAAKFAIMTARESIPEKRISELSLLYGKYFG
ncbi:MAG: S-methyl-5'-thioadenosine phosphorylase [Oligoflexales bacterium]|nr:S-methyl-5'-thioadenosine phosphorylase [Oligoflexales bacterium]